MISLPNFLSTGSSLTAGSAGSSPNAAGATISGGVLTLQPASGSYPGIVSTGTQTLAGDKTFSGNIAAANLSGTNTGDVTLSGVADGLNLSGQLLTLNAATAISAGSVSTGTQTFAGAKTFTGAVTINNSGGLTITGPASSADALIVPSGAYINFAGGTAQGRISWDGSAYLQTSNYLKVPLLVVTGGSISPNASTSLSLAGNAANGATAKAVRISSTQNLTTAGAKVVTFENNAGSTELASITSYGAFRLTGMTTTARDALGAADKVAGSIIYNTTTNKLNFYNGSAWEVVTSA